MRSRILRLKNRSHHLLHTLYSGPLQVVNSSESCPVPVAAVVSLWHHRTVLLVRHLSPLCLGCSSVLDLHTRLVVVRWRALHSSRMRLRLHNLVAVARMRLDFGTCCHCILLAVQGICPFRMHRCRCRRMQGVLLLVVVVVVEVVVETYSPTYQRCHSLAWKHRDLVFAAVRHMGCLRRVLERVSWTWRRERYELPLLSCPCPCLFYRISPC